jgi:hypothetical protein
MAKKIEIDGIDESLIVASIKKPRTPAVPENPEKLLSPLSSTHKEDMELGTTDAAATDTRGPRQEELSKEDNKSRRVRLQEYETLFIKDANLPPARFGKSVYIRKEYHDRISQIISVIGKSEVSLFGYIDNVLTHHFEMFQEEIVQSFKKNTIFK